MWLNAEAYFDKGNEKENDYAQTLAELGLEDNQELSDISIKQRVRLRIDAIREVVETRYPEVSQLTMDSGFTYLIEKRFDDVNSIIDEYYLR